MEGTSQPAKWMQSDAEAARGAVLHHVGAMTPGSGVPPKEPRAAAPETPALTKPVNPAAVEGIRLIG